jgi:hypothetical protein
MYVPETSQPRPKQIHAATITGVGAGAFSVVKLENSRDKNIFCQNASRLLRISEIS